MAELKGISFLTRMRPDLVELETRNIQARVTISMCDARGIPQKKGDWFVVTPRTDRQVELGGMKQDRSSPMPGFEEWNFHFPPVLDDHGKQVVDKTTGELKFNRVMGGRKSFRLRFQHVQIEDAYTIGCRCQRDPEGPKPPGKTPYCSTTDGITAKRWDGKVFADIPCLGQACPLRQYRGTGAKRTKPAKTVFNLVGRIADEEFPALLVSVATGSDFNAHEFLGLIESTEKQWADMCDRAGVSLPMSWYGLPMDLTIYEGVGDETRFPRIHFSLATDLETVFRISIEQRASIARMGRELPPAAHRLLIADVREADDAEVVFPVSEAGPAQRTEAPRVGAMGSLRAMAAAAQATAQQAEIGRATILDSDPADDDDVPLDPGDPLAPFDAELAKCPTQDAAMALQARVLETADESIVGEIRKRTTARLAALAQK